MSFLYEYIKGIAVFLIFSAFAEIIVPNGKYRGYVRFVIGFILMVIILKPTFEIFGEGGFNFQNRFETIGNDFERAVIENEEKFYDDKQKEAIRKKFVQNLEEQSKKILKNICVVFESEFILKNDSLEIERIELVVGLDEEEKNFFRIEKKKNEEEREAEFIKNIKNIISDFYNLSFDNIHIMKR